MEEAVGVADEGGSKTVGFQKREVGLGNPGFAFYDGDVRLSLPLKFGECRAEVSLMHGRITSWAVFGLCLLRVRNP